MFIKSIVKTDKTTAKKYQYYRLCESFRIGKKTRHRNILSLGKLEELGSETDRKILADRIEQLFNNTSGLFDHEVSATVEKLAIEFSSVLRRKAAQDAPPLLQEVQPGAASPEDYERIDTKSIRHEDVREVGAEWMCKQAIDQLDIAGFLKGKGFDEEQINTCLMHIVSRAVYPASEHKTEQWISDNSAVAELFGKEPTRISRHMLYKAANELYELKEELEKHLSVKTNELFDLDDKIILYDLTNTYFEGRKVNSKISQFGRSKEKRSDCKLVVLALVTNSEGFVKYSHFFSGNTADCSTLTDIITTLQSYTHTSGTKPIVALDAGIATEDNLTLLKEKGYDYVCVSRSKLKDYKLVNSDPIELSDNRGNPIVIRMVATNSENKDEDIFLHVHSQQKAFKEASMKQHYNGHMETQLTALKTSVAKKGGVKKYEKVMERIGRIKQRYAKAAQYYHITVMQHNGKATAITWGLIADKNVPQDGVYFLRSSLKKSDERTLWKIYNTLTELEASFRTLKTDLSLRPVFHKLDKTTEAHLFLGILAYNLVASIRYPLKAKKINHDWRNLVRIMNTQKLVVTTMKNDKQQTIMIKACSQPKAQALEIYTALKYKTMPYYRKKFVFPQNGI